MSRLAILALAPLVIAASAAAQQMDHSQMPGMAMPAQPAAPAGAASPTPPGPDSMAGMPGMSSAPATTPSATPAPEANASQPPWTGDYAADRYYDPSAMAHARAMMSNEMGGASFSQVLLNQLEYQAGPHGGGYRWNGEAWYGGDINRLAVRTEGDGTVENGLGSADLEVLYSRAVSRYFDLQTGVRQDFSPGARTYLALGTQGVVPYWFNVAGTVYLSNQGELLARAEGSYDLRLTQRLVLQPSAEFNFAAQNTPETRTGTGLSTAELGLRLRYEIRREFAPYIGVNYDRSFGRTADYARAAGEPAESANFVVGIQAWF